MKKPATPYVLKVNLTRAAAEIVRAKAKADARSLSNAASFLITASQPAKK